MKRFQPRRILSVSGRDEDHVLCITDCKILLSIIIFPKKAKVNDTGFVTSLVHQNHQEQTFLVRNIQYANFNITEREIFAVRIKS